MLSDMLQELNYTVLKIVSSYDEFLKEMETGVKPNLFIVDINLEAEKSGLDVAKYISENVKIPFAFLTSYSDFTTINSALKFQPEAYLIKPFRSRDLFASIEIIKQKLSKKTELNFNSKLTIKEGYTIHKIELNEIVFIKTDNIYIEIYLTQKRKLVIRQSLDSFLEENAEANFLRIHRSYAINSFHIKAINGLEILVAEHFLPISRKYKEEISAFLKK